MTAPWQEHGALSRGVFAVAVLVALAVLFAPPSDVPTSPPGVDKVVHATLFLLLLCITGLPLIFHRHRPLGRADPGRAGCGAGAVRRRQ